MSTHQPRMMQLAAWDYTFKAHLMPLVQACDEAGFEVVCCGASGAFADEVEKRGWRYIPVPFSRDFDLLNHLRCLTQLACIMRRERIDIVHGHTLIAGLLGRIAARAAGVPVSVYTAHGFHFHERMPSAAYWSYVACEALGAQLSDHLFVQNPNDRTTAIALRMSDPEHIEAIGNGVDLSRFDPRCVSPDALDSLREELSLPARASVVTIIARPTLTKGLEAFHQMACALAESHPEAHFVCVLPLFKGERHAALSVFEDSPCAERLRILGFRHDIPEILALTDVFVLPSSFEGLSKVIIEAMAMATPVVTTDVRGCRELVEDGASGTLVPLGSVEALTAAVRDLLDDPKARLEMGTRARARALAHFDQGPTLDRQIARLKDLVRKHPHLP